MRRSKDRKDEPQSRPQAGPTDVVNEASERLATIVTAAERAAEQVIDDAEGQAREIIAEAEAEAERIRGEAIAAVERARRELGALAADAPAPAESVPSRNHLSAVPVTEPAGFSAPEPEEGLESLPEPQPPAPRALAEAGEPVAAGGSKRGTPAGARLLATQMAVSGSSREEIEARLRNGFEIEDTTAILDAILGPED